MKSQAPEHLLPLLSHQEKHDLAERRLADLNAAIAAFENELAETGANIPSVGHLIKRREDLLADRAIGAATQADIDALDNQIAAETHAAADAVKSAGECISDAKQTLQGLARKRDQAIQDLQALADTSDGIVFAAIRNEMELVCAQYVAAAIAVKTQFLRLLALERMSTKFIGSGVGAVGGNAEMTLPFIRLPQCDGLASSWNAAQGVLFANDTIFSQQVGRAVVAERERFSNAGVTRYVV